MMDLKKLMVVAFAFCLMANGAQAMDDVAKAGTEPVTGTVVGSPEPRGQRIDSHVESLFSCIWGGDANLLKRRLMSEGLPKRRLLELYGEDTPRSLLSVAIKLHVVSEEVVAVILDAAQLIECLTEVLSCKSCVSHGNVRVWITPLVLAVRLNKESVVKMLARAMTASLASISTQGPEVASSHFGQRLMTVFPDIQEALEDVERGGLVDIRDFLRRLIACTTFEEAKAWVGLRYKPVFL